MNAGIHDYVVLRLAPDELRGEVINVGVAVLPPGMADVRFMAPLSKLQALGLQWNRARARQWTDWVRGLLDDCSSAAQAVQRLSALGLCPEGEPGFFHAADDLAYEEELRTLRALYVGAGGAKPRAGAERRTRLVTELKHHFSRERVLGKTLEDLADHLVVPNVEVPEFPDLKADFVYKNGVYRVTQTLDYRVAPQAAHQKVQEACTKRMAAEMASQVWGPDTQRFAVVHVPAEVASVADPHLDLLYAGGFRIFHFDKQSDLDDYMHLAMPHHHQGQVDRA